MCLLATVVAPIAVFSSSVGAAPTDWPWFEPGHDQRLSLTVTASADGGDLFAVTDVDFTQAFVEAGISGAEVDQATLVVHEVDDAGVLIDDAVPFQFDPGPGFDAAANASGELVVQVSGPTTVGQSRNFLVYFDRSGSGALGAAVDDQVIVTTGLQDEGLPAASIVTPSGSWWYQVEAGGFSSLVDGEANDWIGWSTATGAQGEYRGYQTLCIPRASSIRARPATRRLSRSMGPFEAVSRR